MDQPILNFESEEERRQYKRAQRREYQREYQREYRRRQWERLTDDQREEERRRQSEAQRQRNARCRAEVTIQELEFLNREEANIITNSRQRASQQVSHIERDQRQQVDSHSSGQYNQPSNQNIELHLQNESSRSIERVAETPRPRSQFENNLGAKGDAQNRQNTNGMIRADFQRFRMQF
ncbi:small ribosomal subunit protein bS18c-like [Cryptomeria japonica]|uniref:small ribosomal subunit protein bS18c-like n=1 Tax=Cryptomeria japonica TaxID=3369 RepID=UPI0027DA7A35|nr:small ribosomal subunit protein bS18c-like [Cryptomeria japonica]